MSMVQNSSKNYLELLLFLSVQYPSYIGAEDVKEVLSGNIRTRQRVLKNLADIGYLESLNTHPCSYRLSDSYYNKLKSAIT